MSDLGTLHIKVDVDDSGVDSGLSRTEGKAKGWGGKAGAAFAGALKVGVAAAGVATAGFFAKAISGASDLAESVSKVGVVFGDQARQVTGFADKMAKDFGLPKREILDAAASIGLIGKASGMSQGDAAKMSTELAKLAADASSFYNVPLPEALQAIQSGLVGEAEPMRRFGVLLNAQAVDAEAARLGLEKVNGAYTEGAKAQARASLIMQGMKDASGDLERTQGSLANRLREIKGRAENFAASVGTKVLPLVLKLMDAGEALGGSLARTLGPAFKTAGDVVRLFMGSFTGEGAETGLKASWLNPIIDAGAKAAGIFEAIREGFGGLKSAFSGEGVTSDGFVGVMERIGVAARAVVEWFQANWPRIREIVAEVLTTVQSVVTNVVAVVLAIWDNFGSQIVNVLKSAWDFAMAIVDAAMNIIRGVIQVITGLITGDWGMVWEGIKAILSGVWDAMAAIVTTVLEVISNVISAGWEIVRGIFVGAWNAIVEAVKTAIGWVLDEVRSIPGRVLSALGDLGSLLFDVGKRLISGFINGIKNMFGAVADTLGNLTSKLTSWKGPPSKDARILFDAGRTVIGGFIKGIEASYRGVRSALGRVSDMVEEVIHEDDPRWDWRTMGNRQRGVQVGGRWYIEHADGTYSPHPKDPNAPPLSQGGWPLRYSASGQPYYSPHEGLISTADGGWAPVLDRGGIVTGPTLAMLAANRRPEAVIPLDRLSGMGGVTIIVQGSVIAERQLLDIARRGVDDVGRHNVSSGVKTRTTFGRG